MRKCTGCGNDHKVMTYELGGAEIIMGVCSTCGKRYTYKSTPDMEDEYTCIFTIGCRTYKEVSDNNTSTYTMNDAIISLEEYNEAFERLRNFHGFIKEEEKAPIPMGEVAKELSIKGMGRNKLYSLLRDKNVLNHKNKPLQSLIEKGYFILDKAKCFVSPRGVKYIASLI